MIRLLILRIPLLVAFALAPTSAHAEDPKKAEETIYIKAGKLFNGLKDDYDADMIVEIEGERIKSVKPADEVKIPEKSKSIDLSKYYVLPGFIDCHVHLSSFPEKDAELKKFRRTPFTSAFRAVENAKRTLNGGFTTVRDVGSRPFLAVDLREAIDRGELVGPRIVASGPGISITGGHGDMNNYAPDLSKWMFPEERDFQVADGIDQVRHVVRAQLKYGVDVVKVFATGGVFSRGDEPGSPQFSLEELRVLVDEAHNAGRKVAAHAHGARGIKNAVLAGVDSIEHGSLIDDEGIDLMKKHGTYLVADIYNDDFILGMAKELNTLQEYVDKERALGKTQRENFAKAVKAGVKIAFGTDAGIYPHGDNGKQFYYMVKFGLTPARAIRSATSDAADLIDRSKNVGSISAGKFADIVAVKADPLEDIQSLEHVAFVMKGGKVYKDRLTAENTHATSK